MPGSAGSWPAIASSNSSLSAANETTFATSSEFQAKYVGWQGAFWNLAKILAMGPVLTLAYYLEKNAGRDGVKET